MKNSISLYNEFKLMYPDWEKSTNDCINYRAIEELFYEAATSIRNNIALVYGIPKTGNSTIAATLGSISKMKMVLASHYLSEEGMHYANKNILEKGEFLAEGELNAVRSGIIIQSILKTLGFYHQYEKFKPEVLKSFKISIISSFRDPLELIYSSIFWMYNNQSYEFIKNEINKAFTINKKIWIHAQDSWIKNDFKKSIGFDVYANAFDKKLGYSIYKYKSYNILLIRTDYFNKCLKESLASFFNISASEITLYSENITANNDNNSLYDRITQNVKPNKDFIEEIYSTQYYQHFFSDHERNLKIN